MVQVSLEKTVVTQVTKKFPTLMEPTGFITVFTKANHWTLSRTSCIHSFHSQPIFLRPIFNITFPSTLSPKWSLPLMFIDQNFVCTSHLCHACCMSY